MVHIEGQYADFKPVIPPFRVVHVLVQELPEYSYMLISSYMIIQSFCSDAASSVAEESRAENVVLDCGLATSYKRQGNQNLKSYQDEYAFDKGSSAIDVLNRAKVRWNEKHKPSFKT